MTATLRRAGTLAVGCLAGIVVAQMVCAFPPCRDTIGRGFGRGRLLALVGPSGIYQSDVDRAALELRSRTEDAGSKSIDPKTARNGILLQLIANTRLATLARREKISPEAANFQVPPQAWNSVWRAGWPAWSLSRNILQNVRAQVWIERRISDSLQVREEDCLTCYQAHPGAYLQPPRMRASHIFFAAPSDVAPEVVETKRVAAQAVSDRLARGERFADLVVLSEDESSKRRGGDLNFFSESRMPADFWAALRDLRVGETSGLIRTRLGFHIVQLTDSLPQRLMTPLEAHAEIALALQNQKRSAAVAKLTAAVSEPPDFHESVPSD